MPGFAWRKEKSPVMPRARKYPEELLERGTRLVFESGRPIAHVARDLGIESEWLFAGTSARSEPVRARGPGRGARFRARVVVALSCPRWTSAQRPEILCGHRTRT